MAAAPDRRAPEVLDLIHISAGDLDAVLEEERLAWRSLLSWDFSSSAELVRRFVKIQALAGFALVVDGKPVGYSYYVSEEGKGLIGDLYISRDFSSTENEDLLLGAVVRAMVTTANVDRIEAQLMMMRGRPDRAVPFAKNAQVFPRVFMLGDLDAVHELPARGTGTFRIHDWDDAYHDGVAMLIATTYHHHVDSSINDQYRSYAGARRFLHNVIHYPGCGNFYAPATYVATGLDGKVAGVVLSSLVAPDVGHVTQICVAPETQGQGLGYELLRRAMESLAGAGCEKVSLTVTASNTGAIQLYQNVGFRAVRRFSAYVWEGF